MSRRSHFLEPLLGPSPGALGLFVAGRPDPIATALETAFDSASRRRGLLGRVALAPGAALVIAPGGLIHTFRMKFTIGAVFAARDGRVLKVCDHLAPNRIAGALTAFAVVELAEGVVAACGVERGNRLEIRPLV